MKPEYRTTAEELLDKPLSSKNKEIDIGLDSRDKLERF